MYSGSQPPSPLVAGGEEGGGEVSASQQSGLSVLSALGSRGAEPPPPGTPPSKSARHLPFAHRVPPSRRGCHPWARTVFSAAPPSAASEGAGESAAGPSWSQYGKVPGPPRLEAVRKPSVCKNSQAPAKVTPDTFRSGRRCPQPAGQGEEQLHAAPAGGSGSPKGRKVGWHQRGDTERRGRWLHTKA